MLTPLFETIKKGNVIAVPPLIEAHNLTKIYKLGEVTVEALRGVDLSIYDGEFIAIMGPSGSGKTTLLNMLGGIDRPTSGSIIYHIKKGNKEISVDIARLSSPRLTDFRRKYFSYVFQFYSLIPTLTAKENVQIMMELVGIRGRNLNERAEYYLKEVGLAERMNNYPSQLSGGERQRVALARALGKNPLVLFLDEPTGQLDEETTLHVGEVIRNVNIKHGKTIIMVTHDVELKPFVDRVLHMRSGKIVDEEIINKQKIEKIRSQESVTITA